MDITEDGKRFLMDLVNGPSGLLIQSGYLSYAQLYHIRSYPEFSGVPTKKIIGLLVSCVGRREFSIVQIGDFRLSELRRRCLSKFWEGRETNPIQYVSTQDVQNLLSNPIFCELSEHGLLSSLAKSSKKIGKKFHRCVRFDEVCISGEFIVGSDSDKRSLLLVCELCGTNYNTVVRSMARRKYSRELCQDCYRKNCGYDAEWRKNNSAAQYIAQNRPEVIEKQRISQSERYNQKPELRELAKKTIYKSLENPVLRERIFSAGIKNLKSRNCGYFHGEKYDSLLELAFLVWTNEFGLKVTRYDGPGIPYVDKQGKPRKYFPDFILDGAVVEMKGLGLSYKNHEYEVFAKKKAAIEFFASQEISYFLLFDKNFDSLIRCGWMGIPGSTKKTFNSYYGAAKRWHRENKANSSD